MSGKVTYFLWLLVILFGCITNATFAQENSSEDSISSHNYFANISDKDKKNFLGPSNDSLPTYNYEPFPGKFKLKKGIRVFGWHPYWVGEKYRKYNYSLLTHIAYFSCDINPSNGNISNYNGWDTSSIVPYVKKQNPNCKILLTVTCFGQTNLSSLLGNTVSQKNLINNLYSTIRTKNADGVCIDFENIPSDSKQAFSNFIANLKSTFNQKKLLVITTLPSVDSKKSPYDFQNLSKSIDFFVLMAYDYFGAFSDKYNAGPIAPMIVQPSWINESVEKSVAYYLGNKIADSLLVLGVPYYGGLWETSSLKIPSGPATFQKHRSYSYVLNMLPNFTHNPVLKASYFSYPLRDTLKSDTIYRQLWLDDTYSLGIKYDYILQKKLGGVGIFALGFDAGSNDLWQLLATKFSTDGESPIQGKLESTSSNSVLKIFLSLYNEKPYILGFSIFMVLITLFFVLIKVFSISANRAKLKQAGMFYAFAFVLTILFSSIFFFISKYCFNLKPQFIIALFVILLIIIVSIKVVIDNRNKNMP